MPWSTTEESANDDYADADETDSLPGQHAQQFGGPSLHGRPGCPDDGPDDGDGLAGPGGGGDWGLGPGVGLRCLEGLGEEGLG